MSYWERCPSCGALGKIDEEQHQGKVSIICSECGHHYFRDPEAEFLKRLEEAPDGLAKAWGYAFYGAFKAVEVASRMKIGRK